MIEAGECLAGHVPVSGGGIAQDRRNIPVCRHGYRVTAFHRNNVATQLHGDGATIFRIGSSVGELDLCADVSRGKIAGPAHRQGIRHLITPVPASTADSRLPAAGIAPVIGQSAVDKESVKVIGELAACQPLDIAFRLAVDGAVNHEIDRVFAAFTDTASALIFPGTGLRRPGENLLITQIGQHQQFPIVTHAECAGERDNTKRPVDNAALLEKVISENRQVVALKTVHIKRVGQIPHNAALLLDKERDIRNRDRRYIAAAV